MTAAAAGGRALQMARASYGLALVLVPREMIRLAAGRLPGRRECGVARLLGARHLVQAALTAVIPLPGVFAIGAQVDTVHAVSMLMLAAAGRRERRAVLTDALTEAIFAAAGFSASAQDLSASARACPGSTAVRHLGSRRACSSTIPAMLRSGPAAHLIDHHPAATIDRNWTSLAVHRLEADSRRSADTHLVKLPLAGPVDLYLKDESTHPTGSLKHRLARSLFLYALCNGWIGPATTVVEASSGSTAVSEAYFARLIGVPFLAVMSRATSPSKIALIEREGGRCHLIDDPTAVSEVASRLARELDGHFLDQFTYAERATDWRGNNNIAESTLAQMALEPHNVPEWIVVGAGTGGTAATFGRYLRLRGAPTRLCVVDPEGSAFLPFYQGQMAECAASRIEGIGRARVEPSFVPGVVDRMLGVPDGASVATMRFLNHRLGISAGPSTGTNVFGALRLACEMCADQAAGSIVTLMCDSGARYNATYDDDGWLKEQGIDINPYLPVVERAWDDRVWDCA